MLAALQQKEQRIDPRDQGRQDESITQEQQWRKKKKNRIPDYRRAKSSTAIGAGYQTVSVDWVTGTGVSITVATGTGAQIGAAGGPLEPGGTGLTGQAGIARRTSGKGSHC